MSHSIHMLSIQIDTKSHRLVNQFHNMKLYFFVSHKKNGVFHYVCLYDTKSVQLILVKNRTWKKTGMENKIVTQKSCETRM